jgi:hypothetical protein
MSHGRPQQAQPSQQAHRGPTNAHVVVHAGHGKCEPKPLPQPQPQPQLRQHPQQRPPAYAPSASAQQSAQPVYEYAAAGCSGCCGTVAPFTLEEKKRIGEALTRKLGSDKLAQRQGPGGSKVTYLEGWRSTELANEVFGYNGWRCTILSLRLDSMEVKQDSSNGKKYICCYSAVVRVTVSSRHLLSLAAPRLLLPQSRSRCFHVSTFGAFDWRDALTELSPIAWAERAQMLHLPHPPPPHHAISAFCVLSLVTAEGRHAPRRRGRRNG